MRLIRDLASRGACRHEDDGDYTYYIILYAFHLGLWFVENGVEDCGEASGVRRNKAIGTDVPYLAL